MLIHFRIQHRFLVEHIFEFVDVVLEELLPLFLLRTEALGVLVLELELVLEVVDRVAHLVQLDHLLAVFLLHVFP